MALATDAFIIIGSLMLFCGAAILEEAGAPPPPIMSRKDPLEAASAFNFSS